MASSQDPHPSPLERGGSPAVAHLGQPTDISLYWQARDHASSKGYRLEYMCRVLPANGPEYALSLACYRHHSFVVKWHRRPLEDVVVVCPQCSGPATQA